MKTDPARWRDIADTAAAHAEDLVRVGYFDQAWQLADSVVREGSGCRRASPHATAALERFGRGTMMRHVSTYLRASDDEAYERFKTLCHAIGPAVIPALAEGLSSEKDARARRRLRDILVGFGPKGRESVQRLMNAPNWEVRRTAAYLLREFGGAEGLWDLIPLLNDSEPLVQREAVQGLVMNGSEEASRLLMRGNHVGLGPLTGNSAQGTDRHPRRAGRTCILVSRPAHGPPQGGRAVYDRSRCTRKLRRVRTRSRR